MKKVKLSDKLELLEWYGRIRIFKMEDNKGECIYEYETRLRKILNKIDDFLASLTECIYVIVCYIIYPFLKLYENRNKTTTNTKIR